MTRLRFTHPIGEFVKRLRPSEQYTARLRKILWIGGIHGMSAKATNQSAVTEVVPAIFRATQCKSEFEQIASGRVLKVFMKRPLRGIGFLPTRIHQACYKIERLLVAYLYAWLGKISQVDGGTLKSLLIDTGTRGTRPDLMDVGKRKPLFAYWAMV
ncbi:hypothetical protein [Agrobacterium sp. lyk4-40-TYG-31]|uniref:hypothetical protein n=1 Tax=Agrobacterium sp. lyk4-40-TYG-31 TaxID=3040276 RepID=UPI00254AFCD8|nr:hypothetical protein [Agrobacterium sp. lyk4-40-TYG-31]